mgnify:CR=1 FL=1
MADLAKVSVTIECSEMSNVSAWSSKLSVDLDSADMTDFIDDYQEDILEHIGEDEVGKWLEKQGYRVEAE